MRPIPILLYHSISDRASPAFRPWTLTPTLFAQHLDHLAEAGYRPVTMESLEHARRGEPLPAGKPVVLTVDDGFADFHSEAFPLLHEHGFACTLYVATGYVEGSSGWLRREGEADRPMLSWNQLAEVADEGVEIGAHSHTHPRLDELPRQAALAEIRQSKHLLEDRLQRPVSTFAYPHGYHGPRVRRQVIEAGFTTAAAVRHATSSTLDDPFALSRIIVQADTDVATLAGRLEGHGLPQAPFRPRMRTTLWRVTRRTLAAASPGAAAP